MQVDIWSITASKETFRPFYLAFLSNF